MWDRPETLNAIANILFATAFLLAAVGALRYLVQLPIFPLRTVNVSGKLVNITREELAATAKRELRGNFFTLDLNAARAGFEKLPWVRSVNARRQWPDELVVELEEHVALARWNDAALVNTHGEVFNARSDATPPGAGDESGLPQFVGPEASAKEIAIQYGYLQRSLAAIGQVPVLVQLSARRAWQVRLGNGLIIELGRENIEPRLNRFIAVYARTVGRLQRRLDHVDLRYSNGFAVRIPGLNFAPHGGAANTKRG